MRIWDSVKTLSKKIGIDAVIAASTSAIVSYFTSNDSENEQNIKQEIKAKDAVINENFTQNNFSSSAIILFLIFLSVIILYVILKIFYCFKNCTKCNQQKSKVHPQNVIELTEVQ